MKFYDEQFKAMDQSLQETPTATPEAFFAMNDIAKKILSRDTITSDDFEVLGDIYGTLQDLERNFVVHLDEYRFKGVLSSEEFLMTVNYFLVAKQIGPESAQLLEHFFAKKISKDALTRYLHTISIPEFIRTVLATVYSKIARAE